MKNILYNILCNLLLVAFILLASCSHQIPVDSDDVAVVPAPVSIEAGKGHFTFTPETVISVENGQQMAVAELFAGLFSAPAGFVPQVRESDPEADVTFTYDGTLGDESYVLDVDRRSIEVRASGAPGFFYAMQTLRMCLPAQIESTAYADDVKCWSVPVMRVEDRPRFGYRGLMLDVSRYFMPKENLLEIIDCMAMLKLNNLHLHLTDDNGWRIEIKKYPRLTEIGAWRVDRGRTPFPDRRNPSEGEPAPVGGFYTQDDIRGIVAYAAARQINVIPEIDMPAHSNSALAAYPRYACSVVDGYIGVLPGLGGRNADIIYCAGNDEVFGFLKDVIDEVCDLFPSKYIHLGGDEAWKTYWETCPDCQQRISEEQLADEEALQGWFMSQMNDYLRSKGRIMMGWDEIADSTLPAGAVVFGWRGHGDAALKAAAQGHRFVLTPSEQLYLIRYQGPQWFEPLTYFGNSTLKDVYLYEPVRPEWTEACRALLMGIQGSMWTEFCYCPDDVTYQIFPRLAAVAEVAWSPSGAKDWDRFIESVDVLGCHLDEKGVVYAESMYNVMHRVTPSGDGSLNVSLCCERPDVTVRYTSDGSTPDSCSPVCHGVLKVDGPLVLKAASFGSDGHRRGKILTLPVEWNKATARSVDNAAVSLIVNGVRGSLRQTDFEWVHFDDDASFTVSLGQESPVSRVTIGMLTNYGMAFHKPAAISISVSSDGRTYREVAGREWTREQIFREGNFREEAVFEFAPVMASSIKVTAEGAGLCPEEHLRPGQMSRYCFDEMAVE